MTLTSRVPRVDCQFGDLHLVLCHFVVLDSSNRTNDAVRGHVLYPLIQLATTIPESGEVMCLIDHVITQFNPQSALDDALLYALYQLAIRPRTSAQRLKVLSQFVAYITAQVDEFHLLLRSLPAGMRIARRVSSTLASLKRIHDQVQQDVENEGEKSRFLPVVATAIFNDWVMSHLDHPYPTKSEKEALCQETGVERKQLSIWLTNFRRRKAKELRTLQVSY
eukprot:TRINITY_DN15139_c0_g1_i1.p1 TRINITY_DN15139_c0_g1~~TRINITY_DN15139_c0_g1_i1.p1  ORF type:complete len:222 (-),score=8.62 TRINITY_DN15139_c0_g1_i1:41-706(-)